MSLPTNKEARQIGARSETDNTERIDRFAPSVHSPRELKYWKNLLKQMISRKDTELMSIGISDSRFRNDQLTEETPPR